MSIFSASQINRKLKVFFLERKSVTKPMKVGSLRNLLLSVLVVEEEMHGEVNRESHKERDFWEMVLPV